MGLDRRTVKIIIFISIIIGISVGVGLGLLLPSRYNVQLEAWPQAELIRYRARDPGSWQPWVHRIAYFLQEYGKRSENRMACSPIIYPVVGAKLVCDVPVDDFHPCTNSNQYNYGEAAPCVFLKLNKILNWIPQPYNTQDLPVEMPEDLKQHIMILAGRPEANTVWVSCEGVNPVDKENIGPIQYIPRRGFPAYYFPFTNQTGYLSPLVAVLFEKPRTGVLINIECKAWAKNIQYDRYERRGSVHFELMVDGA